MKIKHILTGMAIAMCAGSAGAQDSLSYSVTAYGGGATGEFAPYMLGSWNYGKTPMGGTALIDAAVHKDFDMNRRFSWEAGVEAVAGYSHHTAYQRYDAASGAWTSHNEGPAPVWLQQLYASVKWRCLFLSAGMKERGSALVDDNLSSGDLVQSNNSRPIAQVRAGLVDFQDIPLTRGWVQIAGCLAYGKMSDNDYLRNHYNYWNSHIATGVLYTYKNIYFRSNPAKPLSVTIGIQSAGTFGGTTWWYRKGEEWKSVKSRRNLRAFFDMLIPSLGNGDGYVDGSHLGSWDFKARYAFAGGHSLEGYFQWLWEDGSSMAKRNKWDGLWGISYHRTSPGTHIVDGAAIEYIDFRDQSGPMHWAPGDDPGTTIVNEATGGDNYYNNSTLNAFANYGMSMGSPFPVAPVYNTDGFIQFKHTRTRGFHAAATGSISRLWRWKAAVSHAVAWGSGRLHYNTPLHNTSAMVETSWNAASITPGLSAKAAIAFDAGKLRGDNFGAMVTVAYTGNITFRK